MKRMLALFVVLVLTLGAVVMAAQPAPAAPGQGEFVPVSSLPQAESLPAAPLLIAAYAFVWIALMAYVWSLWRRTTRLERELADLNRRIRKP